MVVHKTPVRAAEQLHSVENEAKAYELRLAGLSYQQIADKLDCALSTAHALIKRASGVRLGKAEALAAELRATETSRLLQNRLEIDVALAAAQAKGDGQAVSRLVDSDVKISAQIAKLHGLNAVERHEHVAVHISLAELRARLAAVPELEE